MFIILSIAFIVASSVTGYFAYLSYKDKELEEVAFWTGLFGFCLGVGFLSAVIILADFAYGS